MSNKFKGLRMVTAPALVAVIAGMAGSGCSDAGDALGGCEIQGKIDGLTASVDALVEASGEMKGKLVVACAGIAGEEAPAEPTDEDVTTICGNASARIEAEFSAAGSVSLEIVPPQCSVNASAQFDCEASCQAEANCDCEAPSVEARCEGGKLSGSCSGTCEGECQATADVAAECSGTCEGTCEGTCNGTCSVENTDGSCAGECEGTCEGTCQGSCTLDANAEVECSGTCEGSCSGEFEAPKCSGEITPPSCECEAAADCSGGCDGQASMNAECTPASVTLVAEGTIDADFLAAFEANFGTVLQVLGQAEIVAGAMGDVVASASGVAGELTGACLASAGAELQAAVSGAASATASVNVSVEASADVNGSASGGAG